MIQFSQWGSGKMISSGIVFFFKTCSFYVLQQITYLTNVGQDYLCLIYTDVLVWRQFVRETMMRTHAMPLSTSWNGFNCPGKVLYCSSTQSLVSKCFLSVFISLTWAWCWHTSHRGWGWQCIKSTVAHNLKNRKVLKGIAKYWQVLQSIDNYSKVLKSVEK